MTSAPAGPRSASNVEVATTPPLAWLRRHIAIGYFAISYLLSWGVWIPMALGLTSALGSPGPAISLACSAQ